MTWIQSLINYCQEYNIPIEYLGDTLYDPKVVPMIRGKAFEFSVLKDFAFFRMYIAKSSDLIVSPQTGITCTRKKCKRTDCGFIPNYPLIHFEYGNKVPIVRWVPIENSELLLRQLIS
jgi:hypothetical protein